MKKNNSRLILYLSILLLIVGFVIGFATYRVDYVSMMNDEAQSLTSNNNAIGMYLVWFFTVVISLFGFGLHSISCRLDKLENKKSEIVNSNKK